MRNYVTLTNTHENRIPSIDTLIFNEAIESGFEIYR